MSSFFDKLKRGMGEEETAGEPEEEPAEEETIVEPEEKPKKRKTIRQPAERKLTSRKVKVKEVKPTRTEDNKEPEHPLAKEQKDLSEDWFETEGQLAVDVFQTEKYLVVRAPIAGVKPEDLDVAIENDLLSIRGKRKESEEKTGKNYFYQECYWGAFAREIILPVEVDPGRAEAEFKEGVLTIRMPKISRNEKRKLVVK